MSRVFTYSGPFLRGLGDDPSTSDVFASGYDPLAGPSEPVTIDVPYANEPAYSGGYPSSPAPLPLAPDQAAFNANPYAYSGIAEGGAAGDSAANFKAATGYTSPSLAPNLVQAITTAIPGLVSKPSPTVAVPLSPSSLGLWFSGSSFGLPNWALLGGVVVLGAVLVGGSGGRRRR